MNVQGESSMPEIAPKDTGINRRTLELKALISIQTSQDKVFSYLLFSVLFAIISIMSSMILMLHNYGAAYSS